jgi:hypothetical protein
LASFGPPGRLTTLQSCAIARRFALSSSRGRESPASWALRPHLAEQNDLGLLTEEVQERVGQWPRPCPYYVLTPAAGDGAERIGAEGVAPWRRMTRTPAPPATALSPALELKFTGSRLIPGANLA